MVRSHCSHLLRWLSTVLLAVTVLPTASMRAAAVDVGIGMEALEMHAKPVQGQSASAGETPASLSPEAWQRIQAQIEADRDSSKLVEMAAPNAPAEDVWVGRELAKVTASDVPAVDSFSYGVAIDGDTALVSTVQKNGDGNPYEFAGVVYLFYRNQGGPNNWGEVKKLTASDAQLFARFGIDVALNGDTALVGAENGGPGDSTSRAGAAYIFARNQGGANNWGEVKKLIPSDSTQFDTFGQSVALHGDTALVGALYQNGGPGDSASYAGAAYIFDRSEGGTNKWGEVKKLTPSDAQAEDYFGWSVALDGDTALVSAPGEDGGPGDPKSRTGAAYLFVRNQGGSGNWGEVKKIIASDAQAAQTFGKSVALDEDTALVSTQPHADTPGEVIPTVGAAYLFERNEGGANNWGEVKKLTASDSLAADAFGYAVALDGDLALVGAVYEDGGRENSVRGTGTAYLFVRNEGGTGHWGFAAKLTASDAQVGDLFGLAVALEGDTALVGAVYEDGGPGDPLLEGGAAYIFRVTQVTVVPSALLPLIGSNE